MDALFEAINVKDLLSTGDFTDTTSPLSAPDLRLIKSRLESHSLQIKSRVQSYLQSHYTDFSALFTLCNDAVLRTNEVNDKLSDLVNLVAGCKIDVEIREIMEEERKKMRELKVKKELLELVRGIVGISERLRGVRDELKNGRLRFAAEEIRVLKVVLRIGDGDDVGDEKEPVVYGLLRNDWNGCFEEMQELLVKLMENAVQFDPDTGRIRVKYRLRADGIISGVDLRTVLEAMEVIGILDYGLAKVADQMFKLVIVPAVNAGSSIAFIEEPERFSEKMTESMLTMVKSFDPKIEDVDGESIYSQIVRVVKFIFERLFLHNASWIRYFGRLTWPRISELIIANFLSKAIPEDASKLAEFQKIIERASKFEADLKDLNFISMSDSTDNKLSNFAENVEVHFASRKKTEILAKTRNLLLQCDFTIPEEYARKGSPIAENNSEHVVDLLFLSERCVVSKAASLLMELVHNTMKDICLSSPRVAIELYHAARDAILLYEAVIPVKLERQLDGVNRAAVLMHNDCLYLSQEILGLAFEYRSDFPSCIKEHAVFVDLAPRFHVMAEERLQKQIQLVLFNLKEAIDGADGFQNTNQKQQFESAKFSIDQVVFILNKVHIIWEPLLRPSIYKKSMCMVLESVFSRIAGDILLIDDMAADETLERMIHVLLESLTFLMESLVALIKKEKSEAHSRFTLDDLIPSLCRIRKLAELLDMPLKSITSAWESGELFRAGFTMSEVEDFIKAIFTDSPLRKECLWRIENVSI
ncbi:centromere/kinetochore protein zw10 homolog isoform X2 [Mercurialis annua]|uniref:centromere/kinetochore protein zw10 homolog isoform X2 n=1 Tax=Mercurialis annua TaxID=3986 RepID=UPI002160A011|nr:centromere/kinetochore protein zw10 homolog isoform X2 [Mercurialis annua]